MGTETGLLTNAEWDSHFDYKNSNTNRQLNMELIGSTRQALMVEEGRCVGGVAVNAPQDRIEFLAIR